MIQEIAPSKLNNQYDGTAVRTENDIVCVFHDNDILCRKENGQLILPQRKDFTNRITEDTYLFRIDDTAWYLAEVTSENIPDGFLFENVRTHRILSPRSTIYGEMTARHLQVWYRDNRYCGRCGSHTLHDRKLRMLSCPDCGNMIFPKICPAVITAVINGDRILLTRYAGRSYKNYALIAGFTEIGETSEETVAREVFEEAGVHVKNIRYWATQPWGIDSDLLTGYFCDLDGDDTITADADELSSAEWFSRDEIDFVPDDISLTHDMIRAFIEGRVPN